MKHFASSGPVTMRQVAGRAGVSIGTVSLSLRDHPSIPSTTRKRIQKVAKTMGYRPDALVSTLMARVHSRRSRSESPILALVLESGNEKLGAVPFYGNLFAGAAQRAAELGYSLQNFFLESGKSSGRNLHRTLSARGIRGVILGPVFHQTGPLQLPLDGLASCALGYSIHKPALHRIGTHYGHVMKLAWMESLKRGYRRPGFIHSRFQLERIEYELLGAFLCLQAQHPRLPRVPPLIFEKSPLSDPEACCEDFARWFERHRPDVLFFLPWVLLEKVRQMIHIPRDAGLVLSDEETGWTRVLQMPKHIGAGAVDLVVAQIHRNESGVPLFPKTVGINPSWAAGKSLPVRVSNP